MQAFRHVKDLYFVCKVDEAVTTGKDANCSLDQMICTLEVQKVFRPRQGLEALSRYEWGHVITLRNVVAARKY